jgi:hypothetical protein
LQEVREMKGGVKMKKLMTLVLCIVFISGVSALVYDESGDDDVMKVEADVLASTVGIDVPNNVEFGDITKGYISDRQDLAVKNTGTTDITVIPELDENYSGDIFEYLSFQKTLSEDLKKIGSFEFEIEKPSDIGGTRTQGIYMYLDLTEFKGDISTDLPGHNTNVTFWAIPA